MNSTALALARSAASREAPELLSYGPLTLEITNLARSVQFWREVIGANVQPHDEGAAVASDGETLFILREGARRPAQPGQSGLYHVAIGVPTQGEFSRLLGRLLTGRVPISPVDHLMSKAIYLSDPDGLGLEIAYETPERFGRFGNMDRGFSLYDAAGRPHNGRAALDVRAELAAMSGRTDDRLSGRARIAHLHLTVADVPKAVDFFSAVGFAPNLLLPHMAFADLGAGSAYTHRIAVNAWQGPRLMPAPAGTARLAHYELNVLDPSVYASAAAQPGARPVKNGLILTDPTGTPFRLNSPS